MTLCLCQLSSLPFFPSFCRCVSLVRSFCSIAISSESEMFLSLMHVGAQPPTEADGKKGRMSWNKYKCKEGKGVAKWIANLRLWHGEPRPHWHRDVWWWHFSKVTQNGPLKASHLPTSANLLKGEQIRAPDFSFFFSPQYGTLSPTWWKGEYGRSSHHQK